MPAHPVRLLAESKNPSRELPDALTRQAIFWRTGDDVLLALALADNGNHLLPGDVGTIAVEIKTLTAHPADYNLFRATFGVDDCDPDYNPSQWESGGSALLTTTIPRHHIPFAPGRYRLIITHEKEGITHAHAVTAVNIIDSQSSYDGVQPPPQPGQWLTAHGIYPPLVLDHPPGAIDIIKLHLGTPDPVEGDIYPGIVSILTRPLLRAINTIGSDLVWTSRGFDFPVIPPEGGITIIANPFILEWRCLYFPPGYNPIDDPVTLWTAAPQGTPPEKPWQVAAWVPDIASTSLTLEHIPPVIAQVGRTAYYLNREYILTSLDPVTWLEKNTSSLIPPRFDLSGAAISLLSIHAGGRIFATHTSAFYIFLPLQTSRPFPDGTFILITNDSAHNLTIAASDEDILFSGNSPVLRPGETAALEYRSNNTWQII